MGAFFEAATNTFVADKLREAAALMEAQNADPFRVAAYRRAARTIEDLDQPIDAVFAKGGLDGLEALPGIGPSIGAAIAEMLRTGRWSRLERLRGAADPVALFQTIPGVGPGLAREIHESLQVDSLETLEAAAHSGALETVAGIGPRRAAMIRAALHDMLARRRPRPTDHVREPGVDLLLDVDAEYRRRAVASELPTIAPRRMNPRGEAWLPILHTQRGTWEFTALYSNTPRCHDLKKVGDWVVIYFRTGDGPEGQRTVVTETRGPLAGHRVVRGREGECQAFYAPKAGS